MHHRYYRHIIVVLFSFFFAQGVFSAIKENVSELDVATDKDVTEESLRANELSKDSVTSPQPVKKVSDNSKRRRRSAAAKSVAMNVNYEDKSLGETKKDKNKKGVRQVEEANTLLAGANLEISSSKAKDSSDKKNKKVKHKSKKDKKVAGKGKINKLVKVYKIQILASKDLLKEGNSKFCGLSPISTYKENNLYKYYYGESTDHDELETVLSEVKKKIPGAFIVTSTKSIQTN